MCALFFLRPSMAPETASHPWCSRVAACSFRPIFFYFFAQKPSLPVEFGLIKKNFGFGKRCCDDRFHRVIEEVVTELACNATFFY